MTKVSFFLYSGYSNLLAVTNVATTPDKDAFVAIVENTVKFTPRWNATSSRSLDAINEAFKINIDPPAIIYLFTGTDAARSTITNSLIRQRIGTQVIFSLYERTVRQVNIIYAPLHQQYPGQPGGSYGAYLSVAARQSGGRIWPLTQNKFISVSFTYFFGFTRHFQLEYPLSKTVIENALVFDDAQADCSQGATFSFVLDILYSYAYFDITGRDITIKLNNATGGSFPITATNILLSDSALLLLSFG